MLSRFLVVATASAVVLPLASAAFGQSDANDALRTADQAKAMLAKAVAAVKADKAKALDMFNKGEGGSGTANLYVSCSNISDGKFVATGNPNTKNLLGVDARTFKGPHGSSLPLETIAQKPEGEITAVDIEMPKPGADKTPSPKEVFATKVDGLICGVGYYYWNNEQD